MAQEGFKHKPTFIEVQLVRHKVSRKVNIRQAIVIHITNGYATAIVIVAVGQHIEMLRILYFVDKVNAGLLAGKPLKNSPFRRWYRRICRYIPLAGN